jgi:hypothetical protein
MQPIDLAQPDRPIASAPQVGGCAHRMMHTTKPGRYAAARNARHDSKLDFPQLWISKL